MPAQYLCFGGSHSAETMREKKFLCMCVGACVSVSMASIFILNPEICNQKTNFPSGIRIESGAPSPKTKRMNEIIILNKSDLVGSATQPFFISSLHLDYAASFPPTQFLASSKFH